VLNLSMMRLPRQGAFSDEEYQLLYSPRRPGLGLMRKHSEFESFAVNNLIQPGIDHQIDLAFRTFGASLLSPREKDVLELMLRGYGTDTIGPAPGHCPGDRAPPPQEHLSQARRELADRPVLPVLNAMSCLGEAAGEDPLTVYMGPR
jgi:hypothetical protein